MVKPIETAEGCAVGRKHRQAVTAICLTEDDSVGFAGSKDGLLVQWNIETGHSDKYDLPSLESSSSSTANGGNVQGKKGGKKQGSRHVLAVAVSSDGRYLATGGLDRAVHLWDTRTRQHIQVSGLSPFYTQLQAVRTSVVVGWEVLLALLYEMFSDSIALLASTNE